MASGDYRKPLAATVAVIGFCFFLSGFSALVFQVVWARKLDLVFGHTVYAVTTVLAAFMGGLALGSRLLGSVADRRKDVLRIYALLEAGVGLYAILLPGLIDGMTPLFRWAYQLFGGSFLLFSAFRFVVFALLLLPPTTLMGGTLPVLARFFARRAERFGGTVGLLYGWNTFGAVAGALAGGFLLIPALGVGRANLAAASLSVAVGLFIFLLSGRISRSMEAGFLKTGAAAEERPRKTGGSAAKPAMLKLVLAVYFLSGMAALGYELIWTRLLIMLDYFDSDTYSFTTMLTTFLFGLSAGSLIAARFADRLRRPEQALGIVQVAVGCASLLSLFFLAKSGHVIHLTERSWEARVALCFTWSFAVMIVPTLLLGAVLPLVTTIYVRNRKDVGKRVGTAYSANTVGSIVGAVLTGFVFIPLLGAKGSLLLLSSVNVLLGIILLFAARGKGSPWKTALPATVLFTAIVLVSPKGKLYRIVEEEDRLLFYDEGSTATVTVLRHADGSKSANVDGIPVAGTDVIMLTDQKSLAHLPSLVLDHPASALTVGFGSGGSSWSFCLHDHVKKVRCVEIAPNVVAAAGFLEESNHGLLRLGRYADKYGIIIDDAKSYLNLSGDRYDVIATDCTDLAYKSNANLYTSEYFRLCRERINSGGALVIWLNITGISTYDLKTALNTFLSVYPEGSVWYFSNVPTHYVLLLGTVEPLSIDVTKYLERFRDTKVLADLEEIGLSDPWKFLNSFVTAGPALRAWAAEGAINTNENAYLEFSVPRTGSDRYNAVNLEQLLSLRTPVTPFLTNVPPGVDRSALKRNYLADGCLLRSVIALWRLDFTESLDWIARGRELNGTDPGLDKFEDFVRSQQRSFGRRIAENAGEGEIDAVDAYNLGVYHFDKEEYGEAADRFREAVARDPSNADAHTMLGLSLLHLGDREGAVRSMEAAVAADSTAYRALRNLADLTRDAGDAAGAEAYYLKALSVKPDYPAARGNLGLLYFRSGRLDEAEEQFRLFLRYSPGDPRAEAMLEKIRAER